MTLEIWPGQPYPLGATYDGAGVNFSVFSEVAERVELCLFDDDGAQTAVDLPEVTSFCWHGYVPNLQPGQRYGFRVHGPWAPREGHRCNPANLLLDPYAKAIDGEVRWDEAVFSHHFADPERRNDRDSAPFVPRSVVTNPWFDWGSDRPPRTPEHQTVIYEAHVKGLTALHPRVPEAQRGTYAGLAHPDVVEYLQRLGVTAVELMPVHQFVHDAHLLERGLRNYWGYNSIGYFAPHGGYASGGTTGQQVQELRQIEMNGGDWDHGFVKSVGVFLNGDALGSRDERGQPLADDSFFLALNAHHEEIAFALPAVLGGSWETVFASAEGRPARRARATELPGPSVAEEPREAVTAGGSVGVPGRALVVLRRPGGAERS